MYILVWGKKHKYHIENPSMTLYTSRNIQIIHKIYLENYQSPLIKKCQILFQMKRYSTTTSQYPHRPWKSVVLIIILFIDNLKKTLHIQEKQEKRKRKIIWFSLPFLSNFITNVAKIFFKLLRKHFPKTNKLYEIFNKNIVTINYSFMRNMGFIISAHNQRLLTSNNSFLGCKCRNKSNCPLEEKCLTPKVIYQADVKNDVDDEYTFYHGLTESSCKESFRSHTKLFNHR